MSTIFISYIVNEIIDTILNKWTTITDNYIRLVMRGMYWCSICDKDYNNEQIKTLHVNTPRCGYIYGWLYCKRCKVYVDLIRIYYYKNYCNFLSSNSCKPYRYFFFNFYRKSSNENIKPYIQTKAFYKYMDYDLFTFDKKTNQVYVQISWTFDMITWTKLINLSNLIFYNRNIFGYSISDFKIKNLSKKFKDGIIQQYNYSNEWFILNCIFYRMSLMHKHIPDLIQYKIFTFWNDLFIFKINF